MTTQDQTAAPSAESHPFREGLRDGFPIGLGYFAVAFSIGISARAAGLDAFQAFMASLLNIASAGEYVGFALIAAHASYLEIAIGTLVTNARYLLMSTALSQRFNPKTSTLHRVGVGFGVTDEIFGITIARPGDVVPAYSYGAMLASVPLWCIGTAAGVIAGDALPAQVVTAPSISIFGMFLAIIIPAAKVERGALLCVAVGFAASLLATHVIPFTMAWSSGTRTIVLTIIIASAIALLLPVRDDDEEVSDHAA